MQMLVTHLQHCWIPCRHWCQNAKHPSKSQVISPIEHDHECSCQEEYHHVHWRHSAYDLAVSREHSSLKVNHWQRRNKSIMHNQLLILMDEHLIFGHLLTRSSATVLARLFEPPLPLLGINQELEEHYRDDYYRIKWCNLFHKLLEEEAIVNLLINHAVPNLLFPAHAFKHKVCNVETNAQQKRDQHDRDQEFWLGWIFYLWLGI